LSLGTIAVPTLHFGPAKAAPKRLKLPLFFHQLFAPIFLVPAQAGYGDKRAS
jgi:hypothetical protein